MLTPREAALGVYNAVRSMGRGRVRGADMALVTADRLAALDNASTTITKAIGTERVLLREPDDDSLRAMLTAVQNRRTQLTKPGATG